jgi:hypothetical protein
MRFSPIIAALFLVGIVSCRKETSVEGPGLVAGNFMASIDGKQWIAADSLKSATIVGGLINLTGISADNQQMSITLNDTVPGTYKLSQLSASIAVYGDNDSSNLFAYSTNQGVDSTDAGGTVTVINIDPINKTITGTFSFNVFRDIDGKRRTITDGIFYKLPYSASLPPSSSGDTLTAAIDGKQWSAQSITGAAIGNILVINGSFLNGTQSLSLLMPSNVDAGSSYPLDYLGGTCYAVYSPTVSQGFASSSGILSILLNDVTNRRIRGTFAFTATDPNGQSSATYQVTNGFFSVGYQ